MANYKDRYETIAKAVHHDYAGGEKRKDRDKAGVYASMMVRTFTKGTLNTETFVSIVNQFLGEYGDRNLRLMVHAEDYEQKTVGFHVRHYGDFLYVTELLGETRLAVGDRINKINRRDISVYAKGCANWLYGSSPEREFWGGLLMMQWNINVIHKDGTEEELELKRYPKPEMLRRMTFTAPSEGICMLRISQLETADELQALLDAHEKDLASCRGFIIDLRRVALGDADAWVPLMPYIIDHPMKLSEAMPPRTLYKNYTRGNCVLLGRQYQKYLAGADRETAQMIDDIIDELHRKVGTGFKREQELPLDEEADIVLTPKAQQAGIFILTDTYCENDAEAFVQRAQQLGRAVLAGRATMGTLDYTDLVALPIDDTFTLIYPMSASEDAMNGKGIIGKGIEPDVNIPWSERECSCDVILETALNLCTSSR